MINAVIRTLVCTLLSLFISPFHVSAGGGHDHGHDRGAHEEHEDAPTKGPHGGRMLTQGDFALELTIFEDDVPPQFRLYPFEDGRPIDPKTVTAQISLVRFGDEKSEFQFVPQGDFLTSTQIVEEPHSFEVHVSAGYKEKELSWQYESHEGRTEFSDGALKVADLEILVAESQQIANVARVYGKLLPNEDKVAHLGPRFPGIIREIRKSLGEAVTKGEVLAVIESNQSLKPYEIRSDVEGVVIKRHATLGEFVSDGRELFVVADLSEIWADFQVYRDDFGEIRKGQKVAVDLGNGQELDAVVSYVSPVTDEATQSKLVRAVLPNPAGLLRPGLFVSGILFSTESSVPIAVKREAIQTFRDWNVVYLTDGHVFQAMPVELGRKDNKYVEILSGIKVGDRYVARNSFVVKADIEKSGASHDH